MKQWQLTSKNIKKILIWNNNQGTSVAMLFFFFYFLASGSLLSVISVSCSMLSMRIVVFCFLKQEKTVLKFILMLKNSLGHRLPSQHMSLQLLLVLIGLKENVYRVHSPEKLESTRYSPLLLRTQDKANIYHK